MGASELPALLLTLGILLLTNAVIHKVEIKSYFSEDPSMVLILWKIKNILENKYMV